MVYLPHHLLAFGGHQGHVEEEWSCGIRLAEFGPPDPIENVDHEQYLTDTAVPALTAWFGNAGTRIASVAFLKWIKFNEIGPDGRYVDQTQTHERSLSVSGGQTDIQKMHPLQVCMVLTWKTNAAERGPGSRGRIYSPRPSVTIDANGDVAGAERVAAANAAALLLNSLDTAIGDPLAGAVLRPCIASKVGTGTNNQIDLVVVDSSLDIQRRRSNSQSKEISSAPVAY